MSIVYVCGIGILPFKICNFILYGCKLGLEVFLNVMEGLQLCGSE